jgi:hypothetical protein
VNTSWKETAQRWLGSRWTPAALAVAAVLVMLPALNSGLGMDDLVQRVIQLKPDQVPQALRDTGFAQKSGTLRVVLSDLFGFGGDPQCIAQAREFGILAWWMRDNFKAALWRPLSAFTHWTDYRLFPSSPELMHAHSIAWFAGAVFMAALLYREIFGAGWVAGLAGLLFLLDKNTFFPVMFVANRGFVICLFFGALSIYAHHKWRATQARSQAALSVVGLAASLLSNEAGVSTLAFLMAYALFLEPHEAPDAESTRPDKGRAWLGERARRAVTLLPAVATILIWRVVYQSLGHGVANVGLYLDPSQEPLAFLAAVLPRSLAILVGQLVGLPPELVLGFRPSLEPAVLGVAGAAATLVLAALVPLLQRDRVARFWFVAMLLALVPAATVVPLSKNLGFVAVAAFGLIAALARSIIERPTASLAPFGRKSLTAIVCVVLLVVHVPGAIGGRVIAANVAPSALGAMARLGDFGDCAGIAAKDVVVLNAPCSLALMETPFTRFYRGEELPKTLRSLVPGCIGLQVTRADDSTVIVRPSGPNLFSYRDVAPFHLSYAFARLDQMFRQPAFRQGGRFVLKGLEVEVLEVDGAGLPSAAAFRFAASLDSPTFRWIYFDWRSYRYHRLEFPPVGETKYILGPREGRSG